MTETQTVDLAAWLTRIWDEEERQAERAVGDVATMEIDNYGHLTVPASWVLARIAADRKILELHVGGVSYPDECGLCNEPLPCETVRLLASPYKGREGWQEAWE